MTDSWIGVLSGQRAVGLVDLKNTPRPSKRDKSILVTAAPHLLVPVQEAFERSWEKDAHFVGYLPSPLDPTEPFYRLTKEILPEIRAQKVPGTSAHFDVLQHYIGIDWDTGKKPEHLPWTTEKFRWFEELRESLENRGDAFSKILKSAFIAYATRKGFRWVFKLQKPIPVDEAEPVIRGLIVQFKGSGLDVDEKCADWTRFFRLPRVVRG